MKSKLFSIIFISSIFVAGCSSSSTTDGIGSNTDNGSKDEITTPNPDGGDSNGGGTTTPEGGDGNGSTGGNTTDPIIPETSNGELKLYHDGMKKGKVEFILAGVNDGSVEWSIQKDGQGNNLISSDQKNQKLVYDFKSAGEYTITATSGKNKVIGKINIPDATFPDYKIDLGDSHTMISNSSNKDLFVFGKNDKNQLCLDDTKDVVYPTNLTFDKQNDNTILSVATGAKHTLFTSYSGAKNQANNSFKVATLSIFACGDNTDNQIGGATGKNALKNLKISEFTSQTDLLDVQVRAGGNSSAIAFQEETYKDEILGDISKVYAYRFGKNIKEANKPAINRIKYEYNWDDGGEWGEFSASLSKASAPLSIDPEPDMDMTFADYSFLLAKADGTTFTRNLDFSLGRDFGVLRLGKEMVQSYGVNSKYQLGRKNGAGILESVSDINNYNPEKVSNGNQDDFVNGFVFGAYRDNTYNQSKKHFLKNNGYSKIATGDDFVVMIKKSNGQDQDNKKNVVYVWGNNDKNQLGFEIKDTNKFIGNPTTLFSVDAGVSDSEGNGKLPIDNIILEEINDVAAGSAHGLAINNQGKLYGWGDNSKKQLTAKTKANETNSNILEIEAPKGTTYKNVWAGGNRTIALASDGNLYTWGDNTDGILGLGGKDAMISVPTKLYFEMKK